MYSKSNWTASSKGIHGARRDVDAMETEDPLIKNLRAAWARTTGKLAYTWLC